MALPPLNLNFTSTPISTLSGDVTATTGPFFSSGLPQEVRNTQSRLPDVLPAEYGGTGLLIAAAGVLGAVLIFRRLA